MIDSIESDSCASIYGSTHEGMVREENEDAIAWWCSPDQTIRFGLLADGMGGHAGGAIASRMAISTIQDEVTTHIQDVSSGLTNLKALMVRAVEKANQKIFSERQHNQAVGSMGTTIVFVAVWNYQLVLIHLGDSRCYILNGGTDMQELTQLTRDDSVVQAMLEEGVITEADIPNIPYRNRLTNALGIKAKLEHSCSDRTLNRDDILLLCSDGFYQAIEFEDVKNVIRREGVSKQSTEQLVGLSLDNNTDDNTSVLLVACK